MGIKTIIVYLPTNGIAQRIMPAVAKIAAPRKAHVVGLHFAVEFAPPPALSAEIPIDTLQQILDAGKKTIESIRSIFEDSAKTSGLSYEWRNMDAPIICDECHTADLVVCCKNSEDSKSWDDFTEMAILESGRPVLILPTDIPEAGIGNNIVIGWNNTREAARAVFDSLDLLRNAANVKAITLIDYPGEKADAEASGANLAAALARHGIKAPIEIASARSDAAEKQILARVMEGGCDLFVMGGYGRSVLRERMFGGASNLILREARIPILMSH